MYRRRLGILILCLGIGGCSLLKPEPPRLAKLVSDPLATSGELLKAGRYGEAVALLETAASQRPDQPAYVKALRQARQHKQNFEQDLRDRLLLQQTRELHDELPILNRLRRADPADPSLQQRIEQVHQELRQKRRALSICGWRQQRRAPRLATQCLELAIALSANVEDQRLLDILRAKQRQAQQQAKEQQREKREQAWKRRNQQRLRKAQEAFQANRLSETRRQLALLLKEDPGNRPARQLQAEFKRRLEGYIESLLKAGDRLYREGEIAGARATWQAAHNLDPSDPRAKEKIERAQRVLENLERLRKQQ